MLSPKRIKYRKRQKGRVKGLAGRGHRIEFGDFGLKSLEPSWITSRQIEAARQAITRKISRKGKLWIRIFPSLPVTTKPIEVRMGKGKGSVDFWAAKVAGGSVIFELCGVTNSVAIAAFKTGGAKLPVKTIIFK